MVRLGIYVVYDADGIIDEYIAKVLAGLRPHLSKLIVVCNFTKAEGGLGYIEEYADEIKYRRNLGFDAGAYKDVFRELFASGGVRNFDEILLANDSFYGPVDSFSQVFSSMDKLDCDYWGLTKYPGGIYEGLEISPHIQSYFMCFRRDVVSSKGFYDFWLGMEYPETFIDAVFHFEFCLNRVLAESGFTGKAYTERETGRLEVKYGENPYMKYPYELLKDFGMPVIKRKALDFENDGFSDAIAAFSYIDRYKKFDVSMIRNHLMRTSQRPGTSPAFDLGALQAFYGRHRNIYIYGAGGWGRNLAAYFAYKGWEFKKFIVSDSSGRKENVISYDEAELDESDGIIIAVGKKKVIEEIYGNVSKRHNAEHIFKPSYI